MDTKHIIFGLALILVGVISTARYYRNSQSDRERRFVSIYSTLGWALVLSCFLICQKVRSPIDFVILIGFGAAFIPFCHWVTRRWNQIRNEESNHAA